MSLDIISNNNYIMNPEDYLEYSIADLIAMTCIKKSRYDDIIITPNETHKILSGILDQKLDNEISNIKLKEPFALTEGQIDIVKKTIRKQRACIPLKMGSGKTLISLVIAKLLYIIYTKESVQNLGPSVVIAQKDLISSWINEIETFFGNSLKYQVLTSINKDSIIEPDIELILTLPTVVAKCYKERRIDNLFMRREFVVVNRFLTTEKTLYATNPKIPYLREYKGIGYFYSMQFRSIIIDEIQKYTRIITQRSQAMAAVCAIDRILLSGTTFDEPDAIRILGYHVILGDESFPNNLPDAQILLHSHEFKGLKGNFVKTSKKLAVDMTVKYKVHKHVIEHPLSDEENIIYLRMRETLNILRNTIKVSAIRQDIDNVRKFNSYVLSMITYIRQGIVCPLLPLSNISVNMLDLQGRSELSVILNNQFDNIGLTGWLNNEDSVKSSRIKKLLEKMNQHRDDKMVIFTCFRTSVDIIEHYVKKDGYTCFKITSAMNALKRGAVIDEFKKSQPGSVIILTYELGAEGHNLQFANTLFIVDFWWNVGKVNQAISRVDRQFQTRDVNIYFFTSNTGIERALFLKQQDKLQVLEELLNGPLKTKIHSLKMEDVLQIIDTCENTNLVNNIHIK